MSEEVGWIGKGKGKKVRRMSKEGHPHPRSQHPPMFHVEHTATLLAGRHAPTRSHPSTDARLDTRARRIAGPETRGGRARGKGVKKKGGASPATKILSLNPPPTFPYNFTLFFSPLT